MRFDNEEDNNNYEELKGFFNMTKVDIIMAYNKLMVLLIGFFGGENLKRDGHPILGWALFITCIIIINLHLHKTYCYYVSIKYDDATEEQYVSVMSDRYIELEALDTFRECIDEVLVAFKEKQIECDIPEDYVITGVKYAKTRYQISFSSKPKRPL